LFFPEGHLYLHIVLPRRTSLSSRCSFQKDIFICTLFFPEGHLYLHVVLPRMTFLSTRCSSQKDKRARQCPENRGTLDRKYIPLFSLRRVSEFAVKPRSVLPHIPVLHSCA
jgi:hypothetical protein